MATLMHRHRACLFPPGGPESAGFDIGALAPRRALTPQTEVGMSQQRYCARTVFDSPADSPGAKGRPPGPTGLVEQR
jgi:hypothetical protein